MKNRNRLRSTTTTTIASKQKQNHLCIWKSKAFTDEAWYGSWESREGKLVAAVSKDGSLKVWRVTQLESQLEGQGQEQGQGENKNMKEIRVDLVFQLVGARYQPISYVKFRPRARPPSDEEEEKENQDIVFMFGRSHADVAVLLRQEKISVGVGVGTNHEPICLRLDEERASRDVVARSFVRKFGGGFWLNETVFWSSSVEFEMTPVDGIVQVFCLMNVSVVEMEEDDYAEDGGGEPSPTLQMKSTKIRLAVRKRDEEGWDAQQEVALPFAASRDWVFFFRRWKIHRMPIDRFLDPNFVSESGETEDEGNGNDENREIVLTDDDLEEIDLFGGTENHVYISTTEVTPDGRFLVMNYKPVVIPTDIDEVFQLKLKGMFPPVENEYRLLLYDLVNDVPIQIVAGHRTVRYECLFPCFFGEYVASGSMCENLFCWDARYGIPVVKTKAHDLSTNVATCGPEGTPNEGLLMTVGDDGYVGIWSVFRPDCIASSSPPEDDANVDDDI